jgi:hypothetical protein
VQPEEELEAAEARSLSRAAVREAEEAEASPPSQARRLAEARLASWYAPRLRERMLRFPGTR